MARNPGYSKLSHLTAVKVLLHETLFKCYINWSIFPNLARLKGLYLILKNASSLYINIFSFLWGLREAKLRLECTEKFVFLWEERWEKIGSFHTLKVSFSRHFVMCFLHSLCAYLRPGFPGHLFLMRFDDEAINRVTTEMILHLFSSNLFTLPSSKIV